jgi:hypothetical protein
MGVVTRVGSRPPPLWIVALTGDADCGRPGTVQHRLRRAETTAVGAYLLAGPMV